MAIEDEPDPLERILRSITDPEHLRELTLYMSERALDIFTEVCKGLTDAEVRQGVLDGTLRATVHRIAHENFDATMRRWLIEKGYL